MAAMMLADMGATVLRIDRKEPSGVGVPRPQRFDLVLRGRRSVPLDLKQPDAVAFVLDLLVPSELPIVLTGAMRNSSLPGSDGPANILDAVRVAASADAYGYGALVVFNNEIHAARFVRKRHATSTSTFGSPLTGPVGYVVEDRVRVRVPGGELQVTLGPTVRLGGPVVHVFDVDVDIDGAALRPVKQTS